MQEMSVSCTMRLLTGNMVPVPVAPQDGRSDESSESTQTFYFYLCFILHFFSTFCIGILSVRAILYSILI